MRKLPPEERVRRRKERMRKWYLAHREDAAEKVRQRKSTPEGAEALKNAELRCKYGIDLKRFGELLADQQELCAGCREPFTATNRPKIDHNHATGQVRGLLCHGCNVALGLLKEDSERMDRLATYIRLHNQ